MTITSATSQPASACGPPMADISSGMVMKGPTPIMLDMFSAVDCSSPNRRSSVGLSAEDEDIRPPILLGDGPLPLRDAHDGVPRPPHWSAAGRRAVAAGTRSRAGHRADAAAGRRLAALLRGGGGPRSRVAADGRRLR